MNSSLSHEKSILSPDSLEKKLRRIGESRYHHLHPFHKLLHSGKLTKNQVRAWALNRYCYQAAIPLKDATILSRINNPALRRKWRQRIIDHDGSESDDGGIRRWVALTDELGLDRTYVESKQGALPATIFAVEAYVHFVRDRSLLEAIASSLTELFSPDIISARVSGMLANYEYISEKALHYFDERLTQAPRDANFALDFVKNNAVRPDQQAAVINALVFKCNVLWAQLDALYHAYVAPGHIPPGAYDPGESVT